ncbi:hypothetical protein RF679_01555 [Undibacterium cyanobacteriorum]|uniref:STAS domain-containing protein n=1 Tax=Undibacterium cyanobacteriorum TaxID=3073561 RepID=A0ABY9RKU9_9BURK|nr:hypothetical protein [Undibacterium sp. 20NA77.5]WMW80982.1 hypothetical protein RF679_01555 [Undibacterium sp. 20NA77.5]
MTEKKHIARATERKIDAIEFEMSRDMGRPKTPPPKPSADPLKRTEPNQFHSDFIATDFQSTIALNLPTTELLSGHTEIQAHAVSQSESVPILEEAAILFATGQIKVAEHMLRSVIDLDNLGNATPIAWFMLFDLYQIEQNQYAFESLSLDYAGKYETSPPVWRNSEQSIDVDDDSVADPKATPGIMFPSQLDGEIIKLLQKLNNLSEQSKVLRLDFGRVKSVDPVGCGLLLRAIRNLKKSKHDLVMVAAQNLTAQIQNILEVGRRDETEAPWLLLMEILQLLQMKEAFEETSIDYCVTFEVSPPAYEAPANKITTAVAEAPPPNTEMRAEGYFMPRVVEGKTEDLVQEILEYAKSHDVVVLNCKNLERVEFGASAQLLNGLVPLSGQGKPIQFTEVNYLVMHLFNAMGLKNVAAIMPRKHV